ncbi:MAG: outer membrane lipoprotein chaperone LolA [Gammaproteobacteria bacterium]
MKRLFLSLCIAFYTVPIVAADNALSAFLDKLDSLQSSFTQTLVDENGQPLETSSGVLYLKQPGKFHWAYKDPYEQKIISDGESLWVYDVDLEQVTIRTMDETMEQTPAGIILGGTDIDAYFVQKNLGSIEGYDWIELTPRDPETQYNFIKLGFNGSNLGMMIIDDNLGQTTRIDFDQVNRNSTLDAGLFSLDLPANIDVIDERTKDD